MLALFLVFLDMKDSNSRDIILQKLRKATTQFTKETSNNTEDIAEIFKAPPSDLQTHFAEQLTKLGGHYFHCSNENNASQVLQQLIQTNHWDTIQCNEPSIQNLIPNLVSSLTLTNEEVLQADVSITSCKALLARTGTVLVDSNTLAGRRLSIISPIHIVIAYSYQLVYNIDEALAPYETQNIPSMLCFISGNSKTADIEKTLVNGAHGPKELYVVVIG
jgi:L-lactate dehydrogenase complex protein LldG